MYRIVMCHSSCCVVPVYGTVYALVYSIVVGRFSYWIYLHVVTNVCYCILEWWVVLLLGCGHVCTLVHPIAMDCSSCCVVAVCGPAYALVYPIAMDRSPCGVVFCCVVSGCGPVYALVYTLAMDRSFCCVMYVYGLAYELVYPMVMGRPYF
jgi:hypothetical protein